MSVLRLLSAAFVFGAFVVGCNPPPSTFGLAYRYRIDGGVKGTSCVLAGNAQGGSGSLVAKAHDERGNETLPHLWVESHQDGGDTPYTLDVFLVRGYKGETTVPTSKEVLKAVTYDEAFGAGAKKDSFTVPFEGKMLTIEVAGIPDAATTCPFGAESERAAEAPRATSTTD